MTPFGSQFLRRWIAALVVMALLLPTLNGCVTTNPPTLRIDGVVVDGDRRTPDGEGGWVRVLRGGQTLDGYAGMELQPGDRVETTARAEAVIRYPNGTEVLMRPNSGGRIGSFTDVVGEIFVKVKGIFSADTTFVRAGARGTQYAVRLLQGGTTYIVVFEGSVVVESTRNAWASVTLLPGDATFAHPRAPDPYRASAEELRRTQDWVERLERKVPVQTGLSPTGVIIGIGIAAAVAAILSNSGGGGGGGGSSRPTGESERRPTPPATSSVPATPTAPPVSGPNIRGGAPTRGATTPAGTGPGVAGPTSRTAPGATRAPGATTTATRVAPAAAAATPPPRTVPSAAATRVPPATKPVVPRQAQTVIRKAAPPASSPGPVIR